MSTRGRLPMDGEAAVTSTELGWNFIRWGLGLFATGFVLGFVPILHYMVGAQAGGVGPVFLKNITLWWGCPAVLAEMVVKHGSLGMIAIGLCYVAVARQGDILNSFRTRAHSRHALRLRLDCGDRGRRRRLRRRQHDLAELLFRTSRGRKECVARRAGPQHHRLRLRRFLCGRRYSAGVEPTAMTRLLTSASSLSLPWLWRDGRWRVTACVLGIPAFALWLYSGAPMICH